MPISAASELTNLIKQKARLVAMLAPSFPVVYDYPLIVHRLRRLGFERVVEVAAGAKVTNQQVLAALKADPKARFITSPCPSFVRMVRTKYPQLTKYLALAADSPMVATAKLVKQKYPEHKPVFLGPCLAKKLESSEDHPELGILVLTYKELDAVFKTFAIPAELDPKGAGFDMTEQATRIYPTDGGLTETSGLRKVLKDDEIRIVSGWKNCAKALKEFEANPGIRFMDVLFCEGGCINGPGIVSKLTSDQRKQKVLAFAARSA